VTTIRSLAATTITSLFGTILALGLLEIIVRVAMPSKQSTGPAWSDRPSFYFRSPGAPSMQGYPYNPQKQNGSFRVAVIGDSFTFAPYMQFTDAFPHKLEEMLKVSGAPRTVEVINYGVPAYSTSHEVEVAKKAISEGADLIIVQITLNDPEVKHHKPSGITENMQDKFGALKLTGTLGWLAQHWKTFGFVVTRIHNTKTHRAYIDYFNDLFENPRSWKPFASSMGEIVGLARNAKVPVVSVVFPLFGIPMDDRYPFYALHTKVANLMSSLNTPLLDVSNMYKGIPLEHLQVIPGVDRHPNEIAHRMAAEGIYLWLEEQSLIPQDLIITEKFATRLGVTGQRPWTTEPPQQPQP
jgi:hypothetical protein